MQFELCRFQVKRSLSRVQPFDIHGKSWSVKAIAHCSAVFTTVSTTAILMSYNLRRKNFPKNIAGWLSGRVTFTDLMRMIPWLELYVE